MARRATGKRVRWLGAFVVRLPYLEQTPMYEQITAGDPANGVPPCGPAPSWSRPWFGWAESPPIVNCPSDNGRFDDPRKANGRMINNHAFSGGDDYVNMNGANSANTRGVFGCAIWYDFGDITDGLSNTVAVSEKWDKETRTVLTWSTWEQESWIIAWENTKGWPYTITQAYQ